MKKERKDAQLHCFYNFNKKEDVLHVLHDWLVVTLVQAHFIPNTPLFAICVYGENTVLVLSMCTMVLMQKVTTTKV